MVDYVYCGGITTRTVWKIAKSDMSKVAESADYGGTIRALTEDSNYVYCAGATTQTVWKIAKSDMSKIADSDNYGGIIYALSSLAALGWSGKISGVTNPAKIMGVDKANIAKVKGVA